MLAHLKINNKHICIALVVIAALVRLIVYIQSRSLIIDEANVARNIVERGYWDLFSSLDYDQYAPPLYLAITKLLTNILGANDFVLRLLPLLAGIVSVVLLISISFRLIRSREMVIYTSLLWILSPLAIRYATEVKQYSSDATVALILLWLILSYRTARISGCRIILWMLLGAGCIWMSMPAIFILAGLALSQLYRRHKETGKIYRWISISIFWVVTFGVYYWMILSHDTNDTNIQTYHESYFLDFFHIESWTQNASILLGILRSAMDKTAISLIVGALGFLVGIIQLTRKNTEYAILLLTPVVLSFIASHLHLYSLIERLTLFMIPIWILIIGYGLSIIWCSLPQWGRNIMIPLLLVTLINKKGLEMLTHPLELENSKALFGHLAEHYDTTSLIYVQHDGVPAFVYYNEMHDGGPQYSNVYLAKYGELPYEVLYEGHQVGDGQSFWLFMSHTFPEEYVYSFVRSASHVGTIVDSLHVEQAYLYQYKYNPESSIK